eukprot:gnl/Chilomastix_cuspidata/1349.p1 GENE.gnl/Chilomastix_cuspidata/1349~~gnl/Chilomastix_cuspidata/1349.p1  ORF type:complete len:728 (-),score=286.12 gnl/Chilomastix_cuspidata/1349:1071-3254(-)
MGFLLVFIIGVVFAQATSSQFDYFSDWEADPNVFFADYEPENEELLPSLGNGFIATRMGSDTLYVAGIFNGRSCETENGGPSHRARVPFATNMTLSSAMYIGSALNTTSGTFHRRYVQEAGAATILLEQTWYAHRELKELFVYSVAASCLDGDCGGPLDVTQEIVEADASEDFSSEFYGGETSYWEGTTLVSETEASGLFRVGMFYDTLPERLELTAPAGGGADVRAFLAVVTSQDESNDILTDCANIYNFARALDASELRARSAAAWQELWAAVPTAVAADGADAFLHRRIRASVFPILSSTRADVARGLSPGGLGTQGYNGHSFWDTETWMWPALNMLFPEIAAALLEYRVGTYGGSLEKAAADFGFDGAAVAWESARTGVETTPDDHTQGKYEVHISPDVVLAFETYFRTSGDAEWLARVYPLVRDIARFFEQKVERVALEGGAYEYQILSVMPPDEKADVVDNSVYTNAAVALAYRFAVEAAALAGDAESDTALWEDIAANMYIPFDEARRLHPEYDGFLDAPYEINQADVALLVYPLAWAMPEEVAANDVEYYASITDPDGYFTGDSAYCVAWLELGEDAAGAEEFVKAFDHMVEPFLVWSEKAVSLGNLNFITGAGGFLQSIMFGYGGLRVRGDALRFFPPRLPVVPDDRSPVARLEFPALRFRGLAFSLTAEQAAAAVEVTVASDDALVLVVDGVAYAFPGAHTFASSEFCVALDAAACD